MSLADVLVTKKGERAIALMNKKSLLAQQVDLINKVENLYGYLFGVGTDEGILKFFQLYYQEAFLITGRATSRPSLKDFSEAQWRNKLIAATATAGDKDYPLASDNSKSLFPPDANNIGAVDLNLSSPWLTDNSDDGNVSSGFISHLNAVTTDIGTAAVLGSKPAPSLGTGLRGVRTADNTPFVPGAVNPSPPPPNLPDSYGNGTIDNPDCYPATERTNLLNALNQLTTDLNTHIAAMNVIITPLTKVQSHLNATFIDGQIESDTPTSDVSNMTTLIATLGTHLTTLAAFITYFTSFTASSTDISGQSGYVRATFDTKYITDLPAFLSTLQTFFVNRSNAIPGILGTSSTGLRKQRLIWATLLIEKYKGPVHALQGMGKALSDNQRDIDNANATLTRFSVPTSGMAPTPDGVTIFSNPLMDLVSKQTVNTRLQLIWKSSQFVSLYKVYRKPFPFVYSETAWTESDPGIVIASVTTIDDSGLVSTIYSDIGVNTSLAWVYRIIAFDVNPGRADSFDSSSLQSAILPNLIGILSISPDKFTTVFPHNISSGMTVGVKHADLSVTFHKVVDAADSELILSPMPTTGISLGVCPTIYLPS